VNDDAPENVAPEVVDYSDTVTVGFIKKDAYYSLGEIDYLPIIIDLTNRSPKKLTVSNFVFEIRSTSNPSALLTTDLDPKFVGFRLIYDAHYAGAPQAMIIEGPVYLKENNCGDHDCSDWQVVRFANSKQTLLSRAQSNATGEMFLLYTDIHPVFAEAGDMVSITFYPEKLKFEDENGVKVNTEDVLVNSAPITENFRYQ